MTNSQEGSHFQANTEKPVDGPRYPAVLYTTPKVTDNKTSTPIQLSQFIKNGGKYDRTSGLHEIEGQATLIPNTLISLRKAGNSKDDSKENINELQWLKFRELQNYRNAGQGKRDTS